MSKTIFVTTLIVILVAFCSLAYAAVPITLTDFLGPNSVVNIDAYTQAGVYEWLVDGVNHINQNSYWFRIGDGDITPITALGTPTIIPTLDMMCDVLYSGDMLDVQISYMLMGAAEGSGQSDIGQIVSITNKSGEILDLHWYEYLNLDLNGISSGQTGDLSDSTLTQTLGATQSMLSLLTVPDLVEVGDAATLLGKLNSNGTFVDNAYYEGDVAGVFQWNVLLDDSWMMSQDNALFGGAAVPEPSSLLALAGFAGLVPLMRRRSA
ncbi:MAG: hypothetical protein ACOX3G_05870 [Armatimonadota bacterium]